MKNKIKLKVIRTHYPHWGKYTGVHQYIQYLDKELFDIEEILVPMGEDNWKLPFGKKYIQNKIKTKGVKPYNINDFIAEIKVFFQSMFRRYDIILFHDAEHGLAFLPFLLRTFSWLFLKKPVVIGMYHQPDSIMRRIFTPDALHFADKIILMAPSQKDYFLESGRSEDEINVIAHGVETNFYKPSSHINTRKPESKNFELITVGHWQRDFDSLFESARLLKKENVSFSIVTSNLELPADLSNVTILQNLSDTQLLEAYRGSDALLMPLKDATANNALLEGMACGLPIITTYIESTRYYIGKDNGLFIKGNNPKDIIQAINAIRSDEELSCDLALKARKRAEELSWKNIAETYETYFRTC